MLLGAAVLLAVLFLRDVTAGAAGLSFAQVLRGLFAPQSVPPMTRVILWTLRLPSAVTALLTGAALGISGAVMQTILRNPLASPYTLGVGAGASFGASLGIVLNVSLPGVPAEYLVPLWAFGFAMLICVFLYLLGSRGEGPDGLVLSGIALLFLFQSLQALLQYCADEGDLQAIVFWTFGSLQRATWPKVALTAAVCTAAIPLLMHDAWRWTALLLGDEKAESLGVSTSRLKLKGFFLVSLLSASAVCFTGTIGFIGLAGPHMARMMAGDDHRFYLPLSALCGALILSAASSASKLILPGAVFPVGILTSLTGIPFFFALILRRNAR